MKKIENMNPSELVKLRSDATNALISGLEDRLEQMAEGHDLLAETGDRFPIDGVIQEAINTWDAYGEPGWYRFYYTDGKKCHPIMWTGIESIEHLADALFAACSYAHSELGLELARAGWNVFASLDHPAQDWK